MAAESATTAPHIESTDEHLVNERIEKLLKEFPPKEVAATEFWGAQFDLGLAYVHFPIGLGGLGVSPGLQELVSRRLRSASAPINFTRNPIGVGMAAPTLLTHARREVSEKLLRPCFTTEEIWCQLFSEPGAGSDVAALATRAVRDGDEWIVNGQKVWTTLAHVSRWGMLVARTDPQLEKHKGLTYFIVDMKAPGVEVRPLRQMTGEAEFNEVYFTDVRIPDTYRLGEVGQGWSVAITTLMNERVSIGGNVMPRGGGAISDAVRIAQTREKLSPVKRDELMKLWTQAEAGRLLNIRAAQMRTAGNPGAEGSVAKLLYAELNKKIYAFCVDLMGAEALLHPSYEMIRPDYTKVSPERGSVREITRTFLRSRANSIEGGTSEIMRNILGERVLGLPGDPRVDKGKPWIDVPRS
ncbi:MAG: acyl-CoA dehydrogenase family protein [Acidimicrobiales bacterium]